MCCADWEMGVRLTVDDFGTGYSNLNYLKHLPFKRLKMDRSLVAKISAEPDDMKMATTILKMGPGLGGQVSKASKLNAVAPWARVIYSLRPARRKIGKRLAVFGAPLIY